ncbi:MAG TPA: response regulator [Flavitalea sp.]|nr:response regulator [Flavitalea sp.]
MSSHPIILVDDDEDDRYIFQEGFVKAGCKNDFIQFEGGNKLLDHLKLIHREEYPSLVLLDLNMPILDGREVLRAIKNSEAWNHIPVVVFTTSMLDNDRKTCYQLGANCFISKPSGYREVLEVTRSIALLWCLT